MSAQTAREQAVTRRELLWHAWMSSIALFLAGSGRATLAYACPRLKDGEFGGRFVVGDAAVLPVGSVTPVREGKLFLVRLEEDRFKALYQVSTPLCWCARLGKAIPVHATAPSLPGTAPSFALLPRATWTILPYKWRAEQSPWASAT